jgi:hypothetical protein
MIRPLLAGLLLAPGVYSGRENQVHIRIPRVAADVTMDGALDETVWHDATRLTGFSQFSPQDGVPAADSTEVLLWYSPTALYVGIRAYEAHGVVHATLADRDRIAADDNVQILLGTFHDQRQAYVFGVNPFGVQMDGTIAEQGQSLTGSWTPTLSGRVAPDLSQDFVFSSKGHVTDSGYEVEIRIPFKSLKYQSADVQSWDINIVRQVQHSGSEDSWAPAKRSNASFLAQAGTIDSLSGFDRGLVLDVNPVLTQKTSGAAQSGRWSYDHERPQAGGSARWGLTNNLTLNGTARPDFAEVESDAGQFVIDPRQALFFPEKRPFFLDGLDQFSTPHNLIYTRRIGQPEGALKLTGKVAGTSLGVLSAVDDPGLSATGVDRGMYNILRAQRDVGGQSRLGMAYTDRVVGADYNRVADVDGRMLFAKVYSTSFQAAESFDRVHGAAPLLESIVARNGKRFGFRYQMTSISDDFRAASGFISRGGIVHAAIDHRATWFAAPKNMVETVTGDILFDDMWQYAHFTRHGDAQDKKFHVSSSVGLRGGWAVGAGVYWETFGFDDRLYAGYQLLSPAGDTLPFTGVPRIPNRDYVATLSTPQWSRFNATLLYIGGQDENFFEWAQANIDYLALSLTMRPTTRARVQGDLQYQDYWRRTDNTLAGRNVIPRLKLEYQLTRTVFMRVVGEYDLAEHADLRDETRTFYPILIDGRRATAMRDRSVRGDYLFSYQPNPGTVLFVGYGSVAAGPPDQSDRFTWQPLRRSSDNLFVKYSYLFRV